MQPITVTLSSSGSSPWKLTNWHNNPPMEIGFAVTLSGMNGTVQIDCTLQDPSSVYPSSTLTIFQSSQLGGPSASSLSYVGAISTVPIAAWRITQNASGFSQATALQVGIG